MLRLDPATVEALVRVAARESAAYGGIRTWTAQDVARRAINSYLSGDLDDPVTAIQDAWRRTAAQEPDHDAPVTPPITRPLLQWPGGKWVLGRWIAQRFPAHDTYVEPFGGAASVLLQKRRSRIEVYNDLDEEIVNLIRVLQSEALVGELVRQIRFTPYARVVFERANGPAPPGPVARARSLLIRSYMGHGASGATGIKKTGFRSNAAGARTSPPRDWAKHPDELVKIAARLRGVVVESTAAIPLLLKYDSPRTLFYVDPPYLPETRRSRSLYVHEMTTEQHEELLTALRDLQGMVVLSGYASNLYTRMLDGWAQHGTDARADGGRERVECVWLNPACVQSIACDRGGV
jgi:DNA adenine methylase